MRTLAIILATAALLPGCGSDGGSGSGGSGTATAPPSAPGTIVFTTDVNDDSISDLAVVEKTRPPGQQVTSVASRDPQTGQPVALPNSSVSGDMLDGVLAWDAVTPASTMEASITVLDRGTPKPVVVRRAP